MSSISVFAYATFGSPNGFTQSCIYGNKSLERVLNTFDLKTTAIQLLSPADRIYSLRKELLQDNVLVSYSVYTFAKEKNSNRGGTFIGTSLVFTNQIPEENKILSSLHDIHQKLKNSNTQNNVLDVSHSRDFNIQNLFPKDFDKLQFDNDTLNFSDWENSEKNLVVFVDKLDPSTIQNLFRKSLLILSDFYTIYFIDSKEIADFVTQKKLFRLTDLNGLDQEIKNLENEKKQKLQNKILEFEQEKANLEENRKKQIAEFDLKIKQNEEKQSENKKKIDDSKSNLNNLNLLYKDLSTKIEGIIASLKTNGKLREASLIYKNQRNNFEQELRKIESVNSISAISNSKSTTPSPQHTWSNSPYSKSENSRPRKDPKLDIAKIISVALNFLLLAGIAVFFLFFNDKKNAENSSVISAVPLKDSAALDSTLNKLNPVSNSNLDAKDYKLLAKSLKNGTSINKVVDIIFSNNPKTIGEVYKYQKKDYIKLLLEKNPGAFSKDSTASLKDSVKIIPSFDLKK